MKYSIKLSDAVHILAYIEIFQGTDLSSETIAKSVATNPVSVRKIMGDLKKAGLLRTETGKANPSLTKRPEEISLFDIYQGVEADSPVFYVDRKTAPKCLVGGNIQAVLDETYGELQETLSRQMKTIYLSEIIQGIVKQEIQKYPNKKEQLSSFLS